jgi:nucleoid DNA-binding protein
MRKRKWVGLGVLVGALALMLALNEPALSQRPPTKAKMTLESRVMDYSKLKKEETNKFLRAIGPAIRDLISGGEQVTVPGLGSFRIVRVPAHRDMINGRPATIPGESYVEFLPAGELANAANAPSATPAEVVPPFQYVPLPGRDPGMKVGNNRAPNVRTR